MTRRLRPLSPTLLVPDRTPQRGTRASDEAVLLERNEVGAEPVPVFDPGRQATLVELRRWGLL